MPNTKYLKSITDDFGVWQHSSNGVITRSEGYALDDSARALIVFLLYKDFEEAEVCLKYLEASYRDSKFVGFFTEERTAIESTYPSSEDAFNLGVMALSYCVNQNFNKDKAQAILNKLDLKESKYTRSLAYRLISESFLNNKEQAEYFVNKLVSHFDSEINWFDEFFTYANALMPFAILTYLNTFKIENENLKNIVLASIKTIEKSMRIGVIPSPFGNSVQHKVGTRIRDIYGQQPIDAAFIVLMYKQAHEYLKDPIYLKRSKEWQDWFKGNNIWKKSVVKNNSACADGLDTEDISSNYGAESTIMWLWCVI